MRNVGVSAPNVFFFLDIIISKSVYGLSWQTVPRADPMVCACECVSTDRWIYGYMHVYYSEHVLLSGCVYCYYFTYPENEQKKYMLW